MSAEKIVKAQARQRLKEGGFSKVLFSFAIIVVCFMITECVASVESVLVDALHPSEAIKFVITVAVRSIVVAVAILLSPSVLSYFKMLYSDKKEYDISDAVYYFSNFKAYTRAVRFSFAYIVRMIIPAVVCYLPVAIVVAVDKYAFHGFMDGKVYTLTCCILLILSTFALVVYSTRYYVAIKLFCDDESQPISRCFVGSKIIMYGHTGDVLKLGFSFIFWILLCILVMPILYVLPYFTQAMCISGKWITQLTRNGTDNELF